jgi:hypothetical protein
MRHLSLRARGVSNRSLSERRKLPFVAHGRRIKTFITLAMAMTHVTAFPLQERAKKTVTGLFATVALIHIEFF